VSRAGVDAGIFAKHSTAAIILKQWSRKRLTGTGFVQDSA
jgi:hypothetical protein